MAHTAVCPECKEPLRDLAEKIADMVNKNSPSEHTGRVLEAIVAVRKQLAAHQHGEALMWVVRAELLVRGGGLMTNLESIRTKGVEIGRLTY